MCFHLICLGESCSHSYPRFFLCHMWCWSDLDLCALEIKRCQDDSPATGPAARRNRCKQFLTVIFLGDLKQQTTSRSTNPSVTLRCLCSQLYLYHLDIKPSQGPLQSQEGLMLLYSVYNKMYRQHKESRMSLIFILWSIVNNNLISEACLVNTDAWKSSLAVLIYWLFSDICLQSKIINLPQPSVNWREVTADNLISSWCHL